ncbi:MAG: DUF488 domain-containing protein [Saccharofermentanales bacterium]
MYDLLIKRIYDDKDENDGYRILVDRLWPRGISKSDGKFDKWSKTIAPSTEIRKAFDHKADMMESFIAGYRDELDNNPDIHDFINDIKSKLNTGNVTLLYAAKNTEMNNAVVLRNYIREKLL